MNLKDHYSAVAALGCLACKKDGFGHVEPQLHHPFGRKGENEWKVIGLCATHHISGLNNGLFVSVHPWKKRFHAKYGTATDMLAEVERLLNDNR